MFSTYLQTHLKFGLFSVEYSIIVNTPQVSSQLLIVCLILSVPTESFGTDLIKKSHMIYIRRSSRSENGGRLLALWSNHRLLLASTDFKRPNRNLTSSLVRLATDPDWRSSIKE